jgi:hypothetical protein
MDYGAFKSIYLAAVFALVVGCLAAITAFNALITFGIVVAFLIFGGAYIVHREGWLDGEISIVLRGVPPEPAPNRCKAEGDGVNEAR